MRRVTWQLYAKLDETSSSLFDNEVPEHLVVLGESLLIIGLVIVAHESVEDEEEAGIGHSDGGHSYGPSLLDQVVAPSSSIEEC